MVGESLGNDGSIVFLSPDALEHDPSVLGPFDAAAAASNYIARWHGNGASSSTEGWTQRTAGTSAAVEAIARGHICAPATGHHYSDGVNSKQWRGHPGGGLEGSPGNGSHRSPPSGLQELLDGIPAPDSCDDDSDSATESTPRSRDPHAFHGDIAREHHSHGTAAHLQTDSDRGRPLADGSHYPPHERRIIELEALMRAKDRDLQQQGGRINDLESQLLQTQRDRDLCVSRNADLKAKADEWECENKALRNELMHAKSTIGVLEHQSQQLQSELSKASASMNTLQIRVDELLQGGAVMTASQYEHHLQQVQAELVRAQLEAAEWQQKAADLRALLHDNNTMPSSSDPDRPAARQMHAKTDALVYDVGVQTDLLAQLGASAQGGAGKASERRHMVAQHLLDTCSGHEDSGSRSMYADSGGVGVGASSSCSAVQDAALRAQVRSLELEVEALQHALQSQQTAVGGEEIGGREARRAGKDGERGLLAEVQNELKQLARLNSDLIKNNRQLAAANHDLSARAADREHQVSCSKGGPHAIAAPIESLALVQNTASRGASAMANAGASRSPESILTVPAAGADGVVRVCNLSAAEERHLGRVRLEEEMRRQHAEAELKLAAALAECEKTLKAKFAAREGMLMEDKRAEIGRLRAAWSKHTQESIRAVEERCAREHASAMQELERRLVSLPQDAGNAPMPKRTNGPRSVSTHVQTEAVAVTGCMEHGEQKQGVATTALEPMLAARAGMQKGSELAKELGDAPIKMVLSLNMRLCDVADAAQFQREVHADVVWATGVDASRLVVEQVREGSVLVDMAVARDARWLVQELGRQCADAHSCLKRGRHTRHATHVHVEDALADAACAAAPMPAAASPAPPPRVSWPSSSSLVPDPRVPAAAATAAPPRSDDAVLKVPPAAACAAAAACGAAAAMDSEIALAVEETRRMALVEKMQLLQRCREDCRAQTAAAVADMRRQCAAEMERELELEVQRVKAEFAAKRHQALTELEQREEIEPQPQQQRQKQQQHEEWVHAAATAGLVVAAAADEQVRRRQEACARMEEECKAALLARRQVHDKAVLMLEQQCAKTLQDKRAQYEAELDAVRAAFEEQRAAYEAEVAALQQRLERERCAAAEEERVLVQQRWQEGLDGAELSCGQLLETCAQGLSMLDAALQAHARALKRADAETERQVAALHHECRSRLEGLVREVEDKETSLQGHHAQKLATAEKRLSERLEQAHTACERRVRELERVCQERMDGLVGEVEAQEARLRTCKEQLEATCKETQEQRDSLLRSAVSELEASLNRELEAELATVRGQYERMLKQRREEEEATYAASLAELQQQLAQQLAREVAHAEERLQGERERLESEFEQESECVREELLVRDALKLDDLRKKLAHERSQAAQRLIEEAVSAAGHVRRQTEAILLEEFRKEVSSVQAAHAARKAEHMSAMHAAHASELMQLKRRLEDEHRFESEQVRQGLSAAAEAERERAEKKMTDETKREVAALEQAAAEALERERRRLEDEDTQAREEMAARRERAQREREAALCECEREWARRLDADLAELRRRMQEEARHKVAALGPALRELADLSKEEAEMRKGFAAWLAAAVDGVAPVLAGERAAELARRERQAAEDQADAVRELEEEIARDTEAELQRLVQGCMEERREAVRQLAADAKAEVDRMRAELDCKHDARLSAALEQVRSAMAAEAEQRAESTALAERKRTALEVETVRQRAELDKEAAVQAAKEESERAIAAEVAKMCDELRAAHEGEHAALLCELEAARKGEVESVRCQVRAETSKQVEEVQAQASMERHRRLEAMSRSCAAEARRSRLEVEMHAKEAREAALARCRADAEAEQQATLDDLAAASKAQTEHEVNSQRKDGRAKIARETLDLEAKHEAQRTAQVAALREQLAARHREVVAQRRGELQREMESRMHEVQQQAGADLQAALDELEKEETAKGHAALADVRKDAAARLEADMAALEAEMTDRRGAVLQSVEQECQDQMKLETDKMHRFFADSRGECVRVLKSELEREAQGQLEEKQLRSEMELARRVSALRSECLADLERCRGLLEDRNSQAAQKLMTLIRLKHLSESDKQVNSGEGNALKHKEILLEELRDEWRLVRDLVACLHLEPPPPPPRTQDRESAELMNKRLQDVEHEVHQLDTVLSRVLVHAARLVNASQTESHAGLEPEERRGGGGLSSSRFAVKEQTPVKVLLRQAIRTADAQPTKRALRYPADGDTLDTPPPGSAVMMESTVAGTTVAAGSPHAVDDSCRTPSAQWSITGSMSRCESVAGLATLCLDGTGCPRDTLSPPHAAPPTLAAASPGTLAAPATRKPSQISRGSARGSEAVVTRSEGKSGMQDSEERAAAPRRARVVDSLELDDVRRTRMLASTSDSDSCDSLDSDAGREVGKRSDGAQQRFQEQRRRPGPGSAQTTPERDRLLFSLLRRSSTRRSLTRMFAASTSPAASSSLAARPQ